MESFIRKLETFSPLADDDKALLHSLAVRSKIVGPQTDLISEGEEPSDVLLIETGFACRYKLIGNGRRQIVAYLLPGDICDLHVFILRTMDHAIATISECNVMSIPRAAILQLLDRPALSRALLLATLVDEATLREWIANVGQRRAEVRIAHLFCEIHARMKAVGLAGGGGIDLPVTQAELGDTVGLSVVHVNRSLQSLRELGLIMLRSGRLHIPDIKRLEEMSGFRPNYLHLAANDEVSSGEAAAFQPNGTSSNIGVQLRAASR